VEGRRRDGGVDEKRCVPTLCADGLVGLSACNPVALMGNFIERGKGSRSFIRNKLK
jgi:hypothetical protein